MTFTENIYAKIKNLAYLSTDEFSQSWLGQSRSYYSSNKARGIEASNAALMKLMNKLIEHKSMLEADTRNTFLLKSAEKYELLAREVGRELANRSLAADIASGPANVMLIKIFSELNEQKTPSALPLFTN
ncbi:MAG: DUF6626 family protein [Candidatus Puniceispirillaceae bacterium]